MDAEAAFRAGLEIHPDDAGLRAVFADWCEENGRGELASLHRKLANRRLWPVRYRGWWCWYCNPRGVLALLPTCYVGLDVMQRMGHSWEFDGEFVLVRKKLAASLAALEAAWVSVPTVA